MDWQADPEAARRFTYFYETAWKLIQSLILIHGDAAHGRAGWLARRRLKRALSLFDQALQIHPNSWQSLWGVGKIHQRLGNPRSAYEAFRAALEVNAGQADVAREAALVALELGESSAAVELTRKAIESNPGDPGLVCNLALALLLDEQPEAAMIHAEEALQQEPSDTITVMVHVIIKEVLAGVRPCPTSMAELNE